MPDCRRTGSRWASLVTRVSEAPHRRSISRPVFRPSRRPSRLVRNERSIRSTPETGRSCRRRHTPYRQRTNGKVERFIQTARRAAVRQSPCLIRCELPTCPVAAQSPPTAFGPYGKPPASTERPPWQRDLGAPGSANPRIGEELGCRSERLLHPGEHGAGVGREFEFHRNGAGKTSFP